MNEDPTRDLTDDEKLKQMFGNLPVVTITSEDLERLEREGGGLREAFERRQARLSRLEALQALASAYKEGLLAGGKEEAERRMRAKFDEINQPAALDETPQR